MKKGRRDKKCIPILIFQIFLIPFKKRDPITHSSSLIQDFYFWEEYGWRGGAYPNLMRTSNSSVVTSSNQYRQYRVSFLSFKFRSRNLSSRLMRLSCLRDLFDDAGFKKSLKFVLKDKFLTLESTYSNVTTTTVCYS